MKTSIVIRSYNEEKHLQQLLDGIFVQKYYDEYEVILVDSGSTDKTLLIASEYPVKVIHIEKDKFSFGYSLNQGIEAASGKYCAFISAHCYPASRNWLSELVKPFRDEKIALVYGRQIGNHLTKYPEKQIFNKWFPYEPELRQTHSFCNNANSAIRRSLWKPAPFDETLTGLEDLAWAKCMLDKEYYISYNPDATIFHIHEETYTQICNRYKREAITLHSILKDTKFTFWDFIKLSAMNIAVDYVHSIRDRVFFEALVSIPLFRLSQFYGTFQGYKFKKTITQELRDRFYYPTKYKKNERQKITSKIQTSCKPEIP